MTTRRKYILLTAGTLFLASTVGFGFYVKSKDDTDKKTSAAHTDKKKTTEKDQPKPPAVVPPQIAPTPAPNPPAAQPVINLPSQVLRLANWKLQLPVDTDRAGTPDEIKQPDLNSFVDTDHFYLNPQRNGVAFKANAGGATTKNSSYPRSELREMSADGRANASWSNTSGTHTMTIRQAITHLPDVKSELVAGQIHDSSDDVIMIRLEGSRLFVESGGENIGDLDPNYALGTIFTVKIVAEQSSIKVYYNDALKVTTTKSGNSYYFKAGCYTQTNTTKGDSAASYGEVTIYDLAVNHT